MPNFCECDLYIEGPKARVEEFLATVKGEDGPFDFSQLISYPEQFREPDRLCEEWQKKPQEERGEPPPRDGFNSGGYEWCVANWGTKWNACHASLQEDMGTWEEDGKAMLSVEVNFATAWAPPLPVILQASKRFPDLRFDLRYFEGGCQFNGMFVCEGGEVTSDEDGPYFGRRGG
jgi:hypothetical protein